MKSKFSIARLIRIPIGRTMAAALAAVIALLSFAVPANSAPYERFVGYPDSNPGLGTFRPKWANFRVICIDSYKGIPDTPQPISSINDPQAAWMLWKYSNTNDKNEAAALSLAIKRRLDSNKAAAESAVKRVPVKVNQLAKQMASESAKLAGPYKVVGSMSADSTSLGKSSSGTITGLKIVSAAGQQIQGNIQVNLEGPAVFASNKKKQIVTKSGQTLKWVATSSGKVKASFSATKLPPTQVKAYIPKNKAKYQRLAFFQGNSSASGQAKPIDVKVQWEVSITSKASYLDNHVMQDEVFVTAPAGATVSFTSTLYGPLTEQPAKTSAVPGKAEKFYSSPTKLVFEKSESKTVSVKANKPITDSGWYTWVVDWKASYQGETKTGSTSFGEPSETIFGYLPKITTQIKTNRNLVTDSAAAKTGTADGSKTDTAVSRTRGKSEPGSKNTSARKSDRSNPTVTVTDRVLLTGMGKTPTRLTGQLLGINSSVTRNNDSSSDHCANVDWAKAKKILDITPLEVPGDGEYVIGEHTIDSPNPQCVSYVISASSISNPKIFASHKAGIAEETALIDLSIPTIATEAQSQVVANGVSLSDNVIISGLGTKRAVVTGELVQQTPQSGSCAGLDWSDAKVIHQFDPIMITGDTRLTGIGKYLWQGKEKTCLSYRETLTVEETGQIVEHPAGIISQTKMVESPTPPPGTKIRTGSISPISPMGLAVFGGFAGVGMLSLYLNGLRNKHPRRKQDQKSK